MIRLYHRNYLFATLLPLGRLLSAGGRLCVACAFLLGGCRPRTAGEGRANKPDGRAIYAANCASCHGEDGRNDRQGANPAMRLTAANAFSDSQWNGVVQNGRAEMPAFHNRLSAQELQALRDFTRQFTRKITDNK